MAASVMPAVCVENPSQTTLECAIERTVHSSVDESMHPQQAMLPSFWLVITSHEVKAETSIASRTQLYKIIHNL